MLLLHAVNVLAEGSELFLGRGIEHQKVLQVFLVHSVVGNNAVFELSAERGEELFIIFAVACEHRIKLVFDFLLNILRYSEQVSVVLEHFTRDIQRKVGGVNNALYKAEVLRHKLLAVFGDQNAAGIKLQALFVFLCIIVIGSRAWDK